MNSESLLRSKKLRRRKSSIGQLISTLVFLVMSIWLASAARAFYLDGQTLKAILVGFGSILAFIATFRFQIQKFVNDRKKIKWQLTVPNVFFILWHMIQHGHGDAKNLGSNRIFCQTTRLKVQLAWNVLTIRRKKSENRSREVKKWQHVQVIKI